METVNVGQYIITNTKFLKWTELRTLLISSSNPCEEKHPARHRFTKFFGSSNIRGKLASKNCKNLRVKKR